MHKLNSLVDGEKHKSCSSPVLSQFMGRFNPSQARHRYIQQNDVRLKSPGCGDKVSAIIDAPHDLVVPFQQSFHSINHGTMVVGE